MEPNQNPASGEPAWGPARAGQAVARPPHRTFVGGLLALVGRIFWIFFGGVLFVLAVFVTGSVLLGLALGWGGSPDLEGRVQERHFSHNSQAPNRIVIISLEGAILEGQGFVKRQIDRARKDDNLRAIVLRVNSPGGTITGSDYILHHLTKLVQEKNIPLVVSMGGVAASGGYYVSMAVGSRPDSIFAEPTTWTGSIGVIIPHYEAKELLDKIGVQADSVPSGPLKGMGTITRPMTAKEREIFEALVKESFEQFKAIIRSGRPKFQKNPKALDDLATGQVYSARQALQNGLVDKIGYLEDAVDRAIALAGLPPEQVNVVQYRREFSLVGYLLEGRAKTPTLDVAALVDLTVPRAYYLWSALPPLASSGD